MRRSCHHVFEDFCWRWGLFGCGDFSATLLTLAAATLLGPAHGPVRAAQLAAVLYVIRNIVYAAAAYPIGSLADRMPKTPLLMAGYFCAGVGIRVRRLALHHGQRDLADPRRGFRSRRNFRRRAGYARGSDPSHASTDTANARNRLRHSGSGEWRGRSDRQRAAWERYGPQSHPSPLSLLPPP